MVYAVYNGTITIGQEWTDGSGSLKVHTSHYKCVVQPAGREIYCPFGRLEKLFWRWHQIN